MSRRFDFHPVVFPASAVIIGAFVLVGVFMTDDVARVADAVFTRLVTRIGWFYVLSMSGFLLFSLWLAFGRHGHVRLGPDDARPEYSRLTWFAMLFSAGMGIGLLFYGVAEPVMHFAQGGATGGDAAATRHAMGLTFFHWGLHPWACYAIVGLALGYFSFRRGLPLSVRSAFHPLLGDRIHGPVGDAIDTLAVVSTLFGVATSLGLGAMQVNAGLAQVWGVSESAGVQVWLIAGITLVATASVVSGLDVGIRRISEVNVSMAACLMLFVFLAGPTNFLLQALVDNVGAYLAILPQRSFYTAALAGEARQSWLGSWTIFYWAWWIAWSPFVGMFIARVSRGRTIREFMVAVLFAPTGVGFLWFTVFGDTAIHEEILGRGGIATAVSESVPGALFVLLERLPLAEVTALVATACVILFFVTSSDSASLVIDTIASGGKTDPPVSQRVFWALLEGTVAAVLLVAGGLKPLQTASIATALPFTLIVIGMCVSLHRALRQDTAAG